MFVGIANTPRNYAWGSAGDIAALLGHTPSGLPEAELWLGAHDGSPSVITDPAQTGGARTLNEWIAAAPDVALGSAEHRADAAARLPFLMKILAAGSPLSLQAHPSPAQALAGFTRENAAGIAVDAPNRNYRDASHKPELLFALSDTFDALCGFRHVDEVRRILAELRALDVSSEHSRPALLDDLERRLGGADPLPGLVDWLLRPVDDETVALLVAHIVDLADQASFLAEGGAGVAFSVEFATVRELAAAYPGDPGIVLSLLTNRVSLKRGEALYLPAGNIHAYLQGLGVELMASSDNVLRGGLTPKHIDVPELLGVLNFAPLPVPYLAPIALAPGVDVFRPDVPDFELVHITAAAPAAAADVPAADAVPAAAEAVPDAVPAAVAAAVPAADTSTPAAVVAGIPMRQFRLSGPAIAICTSGHFLVAGATASVSLARGESVYITPEEGLLTFAGVGEVFLATPAAA